MSHSFQDNPISQWFAEALNRTPTANYSHFKPSSIYCRFLERGTSVKGNPKLQGNPSCSTWKHEQHMPPAAGRAWRWQECGSGSAAAVSRSSHRCHRHCSAVMVGGTRGQRPPSASPTHRPCLEGITPYLTNISATADKCPALLI